MKILRILLFVLFASAVYAAVQEVQLSELDRYKWEAADAKANFEALRFDTVIRNFIETNPQVKAFSESTNKAMTDRETLKAALCKTAELVPEQCQIKDGVIVKIPTE